MAMRPSLRGSVAWLLLALAVAVLGWAGWRLYTATYVFKGIAGPDAPSLVAAVPVADVGDWDEGSPHRLAVLVTDPASDWLGLVRAFRAHGIPARFTRDPEVALRHHVVLAYPIISGKVLAPEALRAMVAHVHSGRVLLAFELAGGGMEALFGVSGYAPARNRDELRWQRTTGIAREDTIRVGREEKMWTLGYAPTSANVLATFDDGSAAILCRDQAGRACLLGLDVGRLAQMAMDGRAEPINRQYVNGYEPSLDVLIRWIRDLYVTHEPMPWLLSTVPDDKAVAIIPSHDVDYGPSVRNSLAFAAALEKRGVAGTFFIQTKYRRDYNDEVFFDPAAVDVVKSLAASGMEVGSHSVSHSRIFDRLPLGDGRETYPEYRPFVQARERAVDGSILGELRVSRFLLETLGQVSVVSFRPGHLSYPFQLPEALAATGFRYSSSLTANRTLTHLPYQMSVGREGRALAPVFEFPVTIEDEEQPPLGERFEQAQDVVRQIARNQGLVVVLNHPDITGHKLQFEERLVDAWRDTAWIGSLRAYGDWWSARDRVVVDVVEVDGQPVLAASAPAAIRGLTVNLPKATRRKVSLDLAAGQSRRVPLTPDR